MRLVIFEFVLNLLAGVAWFIAIIGAYFAFKYSLDFGYLVGFSAAFFGLIPGLAVLVFIESVYMQFAIKKEQKRQSDLLDEILTILKPHKD